MSIVLSQMIATVTLDVTSAGLCGLSAGVALRLAWFDDVIAFALIHEKARWLTAQIQSWLARLDGRQLNPSGAATERLPRRSGDRAPASASALGDRAPASASALGDR